MVMPLQAGERVRRMISDSPDPIAQLRDASLNDLDRRHSYIRVGDVASPHRSGSIPMGANEQTYGRTKQ